MKTSSQGQSSFWKTLSTLDWVALGVCLVGMLISLPGINLPGQSLVRFVRFLAFIGVFYLLYRFWSRWRSQLLWSLRNRLVVAYLFIAVVPIILLLILASIAGQILYSQLGAYLLYSDIQRRVDILRDSAAHVAAAEATLPAKIDQRTLEEALDAQVDIAEGKQLPGLVVGFGVDPERFHKLAGANAQAFSGLLQVGNQLWLVAIREAESPRGKQIFELTVPVTPELLEDVAPDLGPIDVTLAQTVEGESTKTAVKIDKKFYRAIRRVMTQKRVLPERQSWMDPVVDGFSQLEATYISSEGTLERKHPVFVFFKARRSQLNQRIFGTVGGLSGARVFGFEVVSIFFLLIEIAALVIGVVLTRAITRTVSDLYRATQFVQEGNFTHRVRVERRDQLGVLGDSFNSMTSSITRLVDEQKQLQRLENEISIAREVQDQLFPRNLPHVEGMEIAAICRAARSVSGDYYDFIQLTPTHVAIAIADISGKGISAALLMASLQAALRSQLLTPGSENMSTAELVSRLNKHLVRNTADDRFATFLIMIYDMDTRKLRYTNAGHLPGFCLADGKSMHLDLGGMVLGIVEDYPFEEGFLNVPPEAVLIGYSDGLVEPENAYGEEFGVSRLKAAAQRVRTAAPQKIAELLMTAAEEWSGSPEQADDMTVIVAKLR